VEPFELRGCADSSQAIVILQVVVEVALVRLLEGRQEWLPPILEVGPRRLGARELALTDVLCATPCPLLGSV